MYIHVCALKPDVLLHFSMCGHLLTSAYMDKDKEVVSTLCSLFVMFTAMKSQKAKKLFYQCPCLSGLCQSGSSVNTEPVLYEVVVNLKLVNAILQGYTVFPFTYKWIIIWLHGEKKFIMCHKSKNVPSYMFSHLPTNSINVCLSFCLCVERLSGELFLSSVSGPEEVHCQIWCISATRSAAAAVEAAGTSQHKRCWWSRQQHVYDDWFSSSWFCSWSLFGLTQSLQVTLTVSDRKLQPGSPPAKLTWNCPSGFNPINPYLPWKVSIFQWLQHIKH